ncbi:MAG: PadR family transcriptional regulator [Euryarchaeota archaeon]|nr:PadR family transcriptional regulator [Euryarchaeota archaeon]
MSKLEIMEITKHTIATENMDDVSVLEIENPLTEDIVKSHLEIIVLSMLSEKPMSGYDIIKEIFTKYKVLLSQGTVYPLLYSLKEDGIIQSMFTKGDMRTKIYFYTPEGKQTTQKKINEFIYAMEYFLVSIKRETYV